MVASEFLKPFPVQFSGSRLARWLLKRLGWCVQFEGLPTLQGVLVVYPHTSNLDFVLLLLVKWSIGIPVSFWGKDKLFRIPLFGRWLHWIGGVPVNQTSSQGVVGQAVEQLTRASAQGRYFWLALSPEGTRRWIPGWRSGFYQTVLKTGVPLGLVRLDYTGCEVSVRDFMYLSGDESEDFQRITDVYENVTGYIAQNAAPIRLLQADMSRSQGIGK